MADKPKPAKAHNLRIFVALLLVILILMSYTSGTINIVYAGLSVLVGVLVGLALFMLVMMRAGKAVDAGALSLHNVAVFDLEAGKLEEAARQLEALLEEDTAKGVIHATATLNLGYCYLRQGVVEAALVNYQRVVDEHPHREAQFKFYGELPNHLACRMAEAHALANHAAQVEAWIAKARGGKMPVRPGALVMPEMILLMKNGAWREAAGLAATQWYEIEAASHGHGCRVARVLRAFALSKLPPEDRDAALSEQMLQGARPHRPNEYDYLAYRWPEMDAYLVARRLKAPPLIPKPDGPGPQA